MNDEDKLDVALWRLSVLGSLVSARLEHGDRRSLFDDIGERVFLHPDGRQVELSPRTIESWFYAYRRSGLDGLKPSSRSDRGQTRAIAPEVADLVIRAKREKPRRSIRRIIRMLERAGRVRSGELSRGSVHRLLSWAGVSRRPLRGPSAERRSFLVERAGDLWLGDAMHGPPVIAPPDGKIRKSYLLSQFDVASRYVPHSYFALNETAPAHEYGFKQAVLKSGPPREYYVDLGAAYVARSLKVICAEIGARLTHTRPRDCEAKGAIERWHRTWREEVGDELPERPVRLDELNSIHWAWLSAEYHSRRHETTGKVPKEHWLEDAPYFSTLRRGLDLDEVFLHRARRKVRKDATVRFAGTLLEVRAELTGKWVELRYAPAEPDAVPRVFVDGRFVCDCVVLDRYRNASRRRRRDLGKPDPEVEPTGIDPLEQIQREHYLRTRRRRRNGEED